MGRRWLDWTNPWGDRINPDGMAAGYPPNYSELQEPPPSLGSISGSRVPKEKVSGEGSHDGREVETLNGGSNPMVL